MISKTKIVKISVKTSFKNVEKSFQIISQKIFQKNLPKNMIKNLSKNLFRFMDFLKRFLDYQFLIHRLPQTKGKFTPS